MSRESQALLASYRNLLEQKMTTALELKNQINSSKTKLKAKIYLKKLVKNNKEAGRIAEKMDMLYKIIDGGTKPTEQTNPLYDPTHLESPSVPVVMVDNSSEEE